MKIAVLSGKGGTGKTFVSVNLADAAGNGVYADCDVEEPNGHLFLKPALDRVIDVEVMVPEVDESLCTACRKCTEFCRYNALALAGNKLMVFEQICHSCKGCVIICPFRALSERRRRIGTVELGFAGQTAVLTGRLDTGEVTGVPIVKEIMRNLPAAPTTVIDCPPGSGCMVMESIRDADYCLLVTEPTLFGIHNLGLIIKLVRLFEKPFGVIINKCHEGENPARTYCERSGIDVLEEIAYDEHLAQINADAIIASRVDEGYAKLFGRLLKRIEGGASS
jgi:MinD superfamily P-loop ATPase